jgi:hypothetical protein
VKSDIVVNVIHIINYIFGRLLYSYYYISDIWETVSGSDPVVLLISVMCIKFANSTL